MGTLHEDQCAILTISRTILLRIRNISEKNAVQKIKTRLPHKILPFELMWKNMIQPYRSQKAIWRMRIQCWMTKATDTHSRHSTATMVKRTRLNITFIPLPPLLQMM